MAIRLLLPYLHNDREDLLGVVTVPPILEKGEASLVLATDRASGEGSEEQGITMGTHARSRPMLQQPHVWHITNHIFYFVHCLYECLHFAHGNCIKGAGQLTKVGEGRNENLVLKFMRPKMKYWWRDYVGRLVSNPAI